MFKKFTEERNLLWNNSSRIILFMAISFNYKFQGLTSTLLEVRRKKLVGAFLVPPPLILNRVNIFKLIFYKIREIHELRSSGVKVTGGFSVIRIGKNYATVNFFLK